MAMTKNHRFGLITFFVLLAAAYLVTMEPWKKGTGDLGAVLPEGPPFPVSIEWSGLQVAYPETSTTDTVLSYMGFDLGYNDRFEQASWVAYVLTREEVEYGTVSRTDNFRADTSIRSGSATLADYRGSGFDRGHLAPAADMKWNETAMSESFLLSNMSPQRPSFNRGVWRKLEEQVRDWALEKDSLYVISGPVLENMDTLIGESGVGVPPAYFKILVDLSPPDHSFIGFLLPHEGSGSDLKSFALPVDSLEKITGYDFFATAPESRIVDWLESRLDLTRWE